MQTYKTLETLRERPTPRVMRGLRSDGQRVILKTVGETASPGQQTSLHREYRLLRSLDIPGVIRAIELEETGDGPALVLEDIGGASLDRILAPGQRLATGPFLDLAIGLAEVLSALHRRRIVHRSISPAHVVLKAGSGEFRLIGFGLAHQLPQSRVALQPTATLGADLTFIAPEQTGRMNRSVDYRSDLYSLGATFYRLLVGRPPFQAEDALGLVHDHIAVLPAPPHVLDSQIPPALSRIVMKLLAKMAEDRYQSAAGLRADLERCRRMLASGETPDFEVAQNDIPDRLQIPQKLYGRDTEMARLLAAFERACVGQTELFLVAGSAGVGKTALVHETHRCITEKNGHFIEGKFDQLHSDVPYSGWTQALSGFAEYLLMEDEAQLHFWHETISAALGSNGRVLTDVIPHLDKVIGSQAEIPLLPTEEARNRFHYVFVELLKAIATKEHPLVVFLDDLQWMDDASLSLLQRLLTGAGIPGLLIVGAYRDNEVDALHPLTKAIEALRQGQAHIEVMRIADLSEETVNALISDTLHETPTRTAPLTQRITSQTGGNPFFLTQTLLSLNERQAISFDSELRRWEWDMAALDRMEISDNVVVLMIEKIRTLPPETLGVLPLAACLGFGFRVSDLSAIAGSSPEDTVEALQPAAREGLILPIDGSFQFVHDRVREAAYATIPAGERPRQHLQIGRRLLSHTPDPESSDGIFEIVGHLNRGMPLITDPAERERLAGLNLAAGRRARAAAAFAMARDHFAAGTALLGPDAWETNHPRTLALFLEQAECEYLTGDYEHSDRLLGIALRHGTSLLDRASAFRLRQRLYQLSGRFREAMDVAIEGLTVFGIALPNTDDEIEAATQIEYQHVSTNLGQRGIADLARTSLSDDAEIRALIGLLAEAMPLIYTVRPLLWPLVTIKGVNLCLQRGHANESPFVYSCYAMVLVGVFRDVPSALQFSDMALSLGEFLPGAAAWRGKLLFHHAAVISIWGQHFALNLALLDQAFHACLNAGDFVHAGYLTYNAIWLNIEAGTPLNQTVRIAHDYAEFTRQNRNSIVHNVVRLEEQFVLCLQGKTRSGIDFSDEAFDEPACLSAIEQSGFGLGTAYHHIMKLVAAFLAGDFSEALAWASRARPMVLQVASMANEATFHFYHALAAAALVHQTTGGDEPQKQADTEARRILDDALERFEIWAGNCPANFGGRRDLLRAEIARLEKRHQDAMTLYEAAIESARKNGLTPNEAVACEVAAAFYHELGYERIARSTLADSAACYARWGASGKVRQLERLHSWMAPSSPPETDALTDRLDALSVARAQRAISGEIRMDQLARTLLRIIMEHAGAQTGYLVVEGGGNLRAVMQQNTDGERNLVFESAPDAADIPDAIVNYVRRTGETLIFPDAAFAARMPFAENEALLRTGRKSVLCMAIQRKDRLLAVLYVDNNLAADVFTKERLEFLNALASQAAISLENARLYENLRRSEERFRAVFDQTFQFIGLLATDGTLIQANQTALEFAGVSGETVLGRPFWETPWWTHSADMQERLRNAVRDAAAGGLVRFEATHPARDGTIRTIDFSIKPVADNDGHVIQLIAEGRDITERKQAEAALHYSSRLFNEAQRLAHIGSWELDLVTGVLTWSDEIYRIFEIDPRLFGASYEAFLGAIHPDDRDAVNAAYTNSVKTRTPYTIDHRLAFPDGRIKFVHEQCETYYADDGHPVRSVGTVLDITDRKQAEQDLHRLNSELERRVAERTAQLEQANQELESFSYSISHDLRAPLRAIDGFSHLLEMHSGARLDETGRHYLKTIQDSTVQMSRLITDILDFSRMTRKEMSASSVDMTSLVKDVFDDVRTAAGEREIKLRLSPLPPAFGDAALIRQVVFNLLSNAAKFTSHRPEAIIDVTGELQGERVLYRVHDNGAGFDMRFADRLFRAFQRLHRSDEFEGTGIGLAIVKHVVDRHGGQVQAEGEVDHGATFSFTLPRATEAPP